MKDFGTTHTTYAQVSRAHQTWGIKGSLSWGYVFQCILNIPIAIVLRLLLICIVNAFQHNNKS